MLNETIDMLTKYPEVVEGAAMFLCLILGAILLRWKEDFKKYYSKLEYKGDFWAPFIVISSLTIFFGFGIYKAVQENVDVETEEVSEEEILFEKYQKAGYLPTDIDYDMYLDLKRKRSPLAEIKKRKDSE